jgi:hypothetical protein
LQPVIGYPYLHAERRATTSRTIGYHRLYNRCE